MEQILIIEDICNSIFADILASYKREHNYEVKPLAKMIQKISCLNKICNKYFNNENNIKKLITILVAHNPKIYTHYGVAKLLNRKGVPRIISNKIKRLFDLIINKKELTIEDLNDSWYLNSRLSLTYSQVEGKNKIKGTKEIYSLLSLAIEVKDLTKIYQLLNCNNLIPYYNDIKILSKIYNDRVGKDKILSFNIAQLLFEHKEKLGITDDFLSEQLYEAIRFNDEEYSFLLLKYGANYDQIPYRYDIDRFKAFYIAGKSIDQQRPWFNEMIKSMKSTSIIK